MKPAITKNGIVRLSAPPDPKLAQHKTDTKLNDEEILKILGQPLAKSTAAKGKKKKKKKKVAKKATDEEDEDSSDDD